MKRNSTSSSLRCWSLFVTLICATSFTLAQGKPPIHWIEASHSDSVNTVDYSADGQFVLTGSRDNTIKIWRRGDGKFVRTIVAGGNVRSAEFSADGTLIVAGFEAGLVKIWRTSDGVLLREVVADPAKVMRVRFSPSGQFFATAGGTPVGSVKLWNVSDGTLVRDFPGLTRDACDVVFTPDGTSLAASSTAHPRILRWRISDGVLLNSIVGSAETLAISPDGQLIAAGSNTYSEKTARVWSLSDQVLVKTLTGHTQYVASVEFSPDGQSLITGSIDHSAKLWRVSDGANTLTIDHGGALLSATFDPVGQTFLTGSDNPDNNAKVWRVSDGALLHTLGGHHSNILSVAYSPDGMMVASGSKDGTVRIANAVDGALIRTLTNPSNDAVSVAFSTDASLLAVGSLDDKVRIYRLSDGSLLRTVTGRWGVAFSPDGQTLATADSDNTIKLWRVSDGTLLHTLSGHTLVARSVVFSPDGQLIASASHDKTIRVWRAADGVLLRTIVGPDSFSAVAFSPDGQSLVGSANHFNFPNSTHTYMLFRVSDGILVRSFGTAAGASYSLAFSTDGLTLFTASDDSVIAFYRVSNGAEVRRYDQETGPGSLRMVRSPDGKKLAVGRRDGTVMVISTRLLFSAPPHP